MMMVRLHRPRRHRFPVAVFGLILALAGPGFFLPMPALGTEMNASMVTAEVSAEGETWQMKASRHFEPLAMALLQKDSPCSDGPGVSKDACLSKTSAKCMWLETDQKNICLPCEFGGVNIPCAPVDSVYAGKKVKECQMRCDHQQVISKVSACTDISGSISVSQCIAKGVTALTKCMWTSYAIGGASKSICGPCSIMGLGTIPAAAPGQWGPEGPASGVAGAASMCDTSTTEWGVPCDTVLSIPAVTPCYPAPPAPAPPMSPVPLSAMKIHTSKDAPDYFAVPVPPPYGPKNYANAAEVAALSAGWPVGEDLPPDAAVVIYGPPPFEGPTLPPTLKIMYGPAPPGIPGVPPPGYGMGTVPPEANVEAAASQKGGAAAFLQQSDEQPPPPPPPWPEDAEFMRAPSAAAPREAAPLTSPPLAANATNSTIAQAPSLGIRGGAAGRLLLQQRQPRLVRLRKSGS